jgi:hypothetical protein
MQKCVIVSLDLTSSSSGFVQVQRPIKVPVGTGTNFNRQIAKFAIGRHTSDHLQYGHC